MHRHYRGAFWKCPPAGCLTSTTMSGSSTVRSRTLLKVNPDLKTPPQLFPASPHGAHALGWVAADDGNRIVLRVAAQQFLPLGPSADEDPVKMPASQSHRSRHTSFLARNSSLNPFTILTAQERQVAKLQDLFCLKQIVRDPVITVRD
jgi:hypothetical protein